MQHDTHRPWTILVIILALLAAIALWLLVAPKAHAQTVPMPPAGSFTGWVMKVNSGDVTGMYGASLAMPAPAAPLSAVTGVTVHVDAGSARIRFQPAANAADYCLWRSDHPRIIKFAGIWAGRQADNADWPYSSWAFANVGPPSYALRYDLSAPWPFITVTNVGQQTYIANPALWQAEHQADPPALEIEAPGLPRDTPVTFVVLALSALGPPPYLSLYGTDNSKYIARSTPLPAWASTANGINTPGSNFGNMESDPAHLLMTANGQSTDPDANPTVIAASAPFTVSATGDKPLPSTAAATGVLCDPLNTGTITLVSADAKAESETWTVKTARTTWTARATGCDTANSYPAFHGGDFSVVLTDGGGAGTGNPPHVGFAGFGLMSGVPEDISGGRVLHIRVKATIKATDNRKYVSIGLYPFASPIERFDWQEGLYSYPPGVPINAPQQFAFLELNGFSPVVVECVGGTSPMIQTVEGAAGQSPNVSTMPTFAYGIGRGDDDGSYVDLFVSQTWFLLRVDGAKVYAGQWPVPLPWSVTGQSEDAWSYHNILTQQDVARNDPADTVDTTIDPGSYQAWLADFGMEVLPASFNGNEAACAALIPAETYAVPTAAPALKGMPAKQGPLVQFVRGLQL